MEDSPIPIAELEHGPSKLEEFLDKHQKKLIILAILIFVAVLGYVIMTGLKEKGAKDAGAALMLASTEEEYQQVISDHSNPATAGSSAMSIAQLKTTDNERVEALNHFISNYPEHPGVPAKLLELALIQMNTGNNSDAKNNLTKLLSNENSAYLAPRAEIAIADIAASANELEEAERLYSKVRDAKNHFSPVAAERLLYLKAIDPDEVKEIIPPAAPVNPVLPSTQPSLELPSTPSLELTPETPAPTTEDSNQ